MNSNFEYITDMQYRLKAAEARVIAFESGKKYLSLREEHKRAIATKNREIARLKKELAAARCMITTVRGNLLQVNEDLQAEYEKKLAAKNRVIEQQNARMAALKQQIDDAKSMLKEKNIQLYQVKTELEERKGENEQLKSQINRDYENSSTPSSQVYRNKKVITNNREKTGRKPGGQPGHKGHRRKGYTPTRCVFIPAPTKFADSRDYRATGKTITKQKIDIRINLDVVEYFTPEYRNIHTGQRVHAEFPHNLVNEATYGGSIKAIAFLLNSYCNVSIDKVRQFLSDVTNRRLQLSKGMINGLCAEFSDKTEAEQKKMFADMLLSPVMNVDFTGARVGGASAQVAICATPTLALYFAKEHKGHVGIAGTPVEQYHGILVSDHDITFYSYGDGHQECNTHVLRYLKDSMEREPHLTWNKRMRGLLQEMIHYRNGLPEGAPNLDKDVVAEFEARFQEILAAAEKEYEYEPPTKYYPDGYNLFKRLKAYQDNHLLFLHDVRVPSNNNLCERKGRVFKRKQKQVMAFRSFDSMADFCDCLSMLDYLRAEGGNLFEMTVSMMERHRVHGAGV
jgi:hypothetical protein